MKKLGEVARLVVKFLVVLENLPKRITAITEVGILRLVSGTIILFSFEVLIANINNYV